MAQLVSALINNYNYGRFIGEAIESILNQTYKNIELIIVDDGSTDYSREVIKKYVKEYPEKIIAVYKENGGQASAFNRGFELAKGEIICFLDSDDYWFPTKVEKVVEAHQTADIVEHSLLRTDDTCRWAPTKNDAQSKMKEDGIFTDFNETSALSFKKSILENIFPIPEEGLEICSDSYVFYAALYYTTKIKTIRETLAYYRIHGSNGWYNNETADRNILAKIVKMINRELEFKGLTPIYLRENRNERISDKLIIENDKKYALYGAGSVGEIVYNKVLASGGEVICFIETYCEDYSNKEKNNVPIISVKNLVKYNFDYVIISSSFQKEIFKELQKHKISSEKIVKLEILM